ncbi:MAG: c-type cytochrome biogenesis protein CcsB [bacterium]|nr:c-type cytochrome biogenesis protein CcsB [bacterium]
MSYNLFIISLLFYIVASIGYILLLVKESKLATRTVLSLMVVGLVIHTIGLIVRMIEAGHAPFANLYESLIFFGWVIAFEFVFVELFRPTKSLGIIIGPLTALCSGIALMLPSQYRAAEPLMPALQSHWLEVHVITAFLSYAAFALALGTGILFLLQEHWFRKGKTSGFYSRFQDMESLDTHTYWLIAFGFVLLAVGIITGAVWANVAWGRYWGWDPKETWSLITWLIYAVYLHARLVVGWRGRKAAWFAVIGFIAVLFCYVGVNVLLPGLHSYGAPG